MDIGGAVDPANAPALPSRAEVEMQDAGGENLRFLESTRSPSLSAWFHWRALRWSSCGCSTAHGAVFAVQVMRLYLGQAVWRVVARFSNGKWQISFIGYCRGFEKEPSPDPAPFRDRDANCAAGDGSTGRGAL